MGMEIERRLALAGVADITDMPVISGVPAA
jgi:hypothetical protein